MGDCLSKVNEEMSAPVVINAASRHTASLIFLHGLGDTGEGWAPFFRAIRPPHVKCVLPTAPVMPVTLNMGMQMPSWFDIKGLGANSEEDDAGIRKARDIVHSLIDAEVKRGVESNRIMLGGFSQGGALALYSAFTYSKPLAGVIALSCWLPLHREIPGSNTVNTNIPVLQCHGDSDPLLVPAIGLITSQYLNAFNKNHTFKTYKNMAHCSCPEEEEDVRNFLVECLPQV